jgi:hypothetical protein
MYQLHAKYCIEHIKAIYSASQAENMYKYKRKTLN